MCASDILLVVYISFLICIIRIQFDPKHWLGSEPNKASVLMGRRDRHSIPNSTSPREASSNSDIHMAHFPCLVLGLHAVPHFGELPLLLGLLSKLANTERTFPAAFGLFRSVPLLLPLHSWDMGRRSIWQASGHPEDCRLRDRKGNRAHVSSPSLTDSRETEGNMAACVPQ